MPEQGLPDGSMSVRIGPPPPILAVKLASSRQHFSTQNIKPKNNNNKISSQCNIILKIKKKKKEKK
jgi:hypothetical protein